MFILGFQFLLCLMTMIANQYFINVYKENDEILSEDQALFPGMMYLFYLSLFSFVINSYIQSHALRSGINNCHRNEHRLQSFYPILVSNAPGCIKFSWEK